MSAPQSAGLTPARLRIPAGVPPLSPARRHEALQAMARGPELDVLVVGGGVTGAGAALDAVTRGLRTGLVEAGDWAGGTSSRSSKLIHGGLRYLEMLDFSLVREALTERGLLLQRLAPHLVRPVPFLYPLKHRFWERPYVGSGLLLYDLMAATGGARRGVPMHRHLSHRRLRAIAPGLREDVAVGAIRYYDAQVDDARHTMMIVRTAARYGALCASRARVVGFLRDGDRVVGAQVRDVETGEQYDVRARRVINAAGVWTEQLQDLAEVRPTVRVRASKGIHLVVPRDRIRAEAGMILRTEKSVLFVIPWGAHWIIGTTDTDWDLDKSHPAASDQDIEYLLTRVNSVLAVPLSRNDIVGVYAGLRPLLSGGADSTSTLSREHVVGRPAPGLVVVAGGKYTTYRVMARDVVDAAVEGLDRPVPSSCTAEVPIVGADGYRALWSSRRALADTHGIDIEDLERLLHRYGDLVGELLELIGEDPALARKLNTGGGYLRVEALYAVTHEGALHLEDVLTRRTRISIETDDRGVGCAEEVAELIAAPLGWDSARRRTEVDTYTARVSAERESQRQPDDPSADSARREAPEIVPVA
ncbi:MAG TPA: glycerol-3-phosphate dehydrogenase/oxidase [Kineosporiaceae bacterium]|nr:glycerol-3-phosphate dehydrogenase/oxidase [Kineosporiaceae bacterium]